MKRLKKVILSRWFVMSAVVAAVGILLFVLLVRNNRLQEQVRKLSTKQSEQQTPSVTPNPTQSQAETASLIKEVGAFVLLPDGETPTIATVTDIERLKSQEFFGRAQNGDMVLVYTSARLAVLYRPSFKKVLTVSTVTIGSASSGMTAPSTTPISTPTPDTRKPNSFLLLNGTAIVGLTKRLETDLKSAYPDAIVVDKDNAKKKTYDRSLLVDMTGKSKVQAEAIAKKLDLDLSELPSVEATSGGQYDFLIIAGSDRK